MTAPDIRAQRGSRFWQSSLPRRLRAVPYMLGDTLGILSAWFFSYTLIGGQWRGFGSNVLSSAAMTLVWLTILLMVCFASISGCYLRRERVLGRLILCSLGAFVLTSVALLWWGGALRWFTPLFITAMLCAPLTIPLWRWLTELLIRAVAEVVDYGQIPVFVIAENRRLLDLQQAMNALDHIRVVGSSSWNNELDSTRVKNLCEQILSSGAAEVVLVHSQNIHLDPLWQNLHALGLTLRILPDWGMSEVYSLGRVTSFGGLPAVEFRPPISTGYDFYLKRLIDILGAGLGLVLLAPVLLALAIAVKCSSAGPVFYIQKRSGVKGKPFDMLKFRSMYQDADSRKNELLARNEVNGPMFKMRNDPRITPVGRFIRRYSLDELPQLLNVVRGEMSLVGPRPPIPSEVDQYKDWHHDRLLVLPGMTGLWQVSGRSKVQEFDDMVRLDMRYIQNWSLALDAQILLKTFAVVIRGDGAY